MRKEHQRKKKLTRQQGAVLFAQRCGKNSCAASMPEWASVPLRRWARRGTNASKHAHGMMR